MGHRGGLGNTVATILSSSCFYDGQAQVCCDFVGILFPCGTRAVNPSGGRYNGISSRGKFSPQLKGFVLSDVTFRSTTLPH